MISIVICSINPTFLAQVKANIEETIGVAFEIISIDNNIEKSSISAVYNRGAKLAQFDVICFVHEDVIIHSKDWGLKLISLFADETIGLVGVSGAVYKSAYAGSWSAADSSVYRTHSIQHFKHLSEPAVTNNNPGNKDYTEVAVIDGVFMATRKNVFQERRFDEELLKGFHCYDIDYSLQVGIKYKVVVSYAILLEHFSSGTLTTEWLHYSLLVHKKWKHQLPKSVIKIEKNVREMSDYLSNQCVLNIAFYERKQAPLVIKIFSRLVFKYFKLNKLKYTKQVILFLLNKKGNKI